MTHSTLPHSYERFINAARSLDQSQPKAEHSYKRAIDAAQSLDRSQPKPMPQEPTWNALPNSAETVAKRREAAYTNKALVGILEDIRSAVEGNRNTTFNDLCYRLGKFVGRGLISQMDAEHELEPAGLATGLMPSEVKGTMRSGLSAGIRDKDQLRLPDFSQQQPLSSVNLNVSFDVQHNPDFALGESTQSLDRGFLFQCLHKEEAGDAELLAALERDTLRRDHSTESWYEFYGHHWRPLLNAPRQRIWAKVAAVYLEFAAHLQGEAGQLDELDPKKVQHLKWVDALTSRARKLRMVARVNNVLTFAGELLTIKGDEWDRDPWLLGVPNGVLDLRTGELRAGRPDDYIRTVAPTEWRGLDTPCPRWERFVGEVMSDEADRIAFLQRLLGYSLNGTTREHLLALLVGSRGRNGKRVLCETVQAVVGNYAKTASTDIVIAQDRRSAGTAQPHLMELMGKRFVVASETSEYDHLSVAQVKNITGGDKINARWLHGNPVEFTPTHTIFLQTNRKPHAPTDDDALWERVKVIEFKTRFVDEPKEADEKPRDRELEATLQQEASGILAWLVLGHLAYLAHGLQTPESVRLARDTYRDGESIEKFISDCCHESPVLSAESSTLYNAYEAWCKRQEVKPKTLHWFGRELVKKFEKGRTSSGRTCYFGIDVELDTAADEQKGSEGSVDGKKRFG